MIFVDSSAWVGAMVRADQYHPRAAAIWEEILSSNIPLVTTDYVLNETYTFLRYHTHFRYILKFHDAIRNAQAQRFLRISWTDTRMFQQAEKLFLKYRDQPLSFVDCVSAAVSRELGIKKIFTFDQDFATMGFRPIPPL